MRIGLVGSGGMGTVHYHNYLHLDNTEAAALVGTSSRSAEKARLWNLPLYDSITHMLQDKDLHIDAVDICSPTFMHKAHVTESLRMGVDTIVEKPIALSARDARELFLLAKENGCRLYTAQVLQFTKEIGILRDIVQKRTFGRPLDAFFQRLSSCPEWSEGSWLFEKEKSGLLPYDLHIHDLDIIVGLFGKPLRASMKTSGRDASPFPEFCRFFYDYDDFQVVAETAWLHADFPFTAAWRVVFENAVLVCESGSLTAYPHHAEPISYDIEDEIQIPTGINLPPTGWFYRELSHLTDCIRKGIPSPYVSKEQILSVMEILQQLTSDR